MGWFSDKKDKAIGTPENRKARKKALKALHDNQERDEAAGVNEETPEYLRLNKAANDAEANVPFWGRW